MPQLTRRNRLWPAILVLLVVMVVGCDNFQELPSSSDLGQWTIYNEQNGLPDNELYCLSPGLNGDIWVGSQADGVFHYDGSTWTQYTTADGLIGNNAWGLEMDVFGNLWIGTLDGLSIYGDGSFVNYDTILGFPIQVISLEQGPNYSIWMGTANYGIIEFDINGLTTLHYPDLQEFPDGVSVVNDITLTYYGALWSATLNGAYILIDDSEFILEKEELKLTNDSISAIYADSRGDIWIASHKQEYVTRYSIDQERVDQVDLNIGKDTVSVNSITQDLQGNIWFGTVGDGVVIFDGTTTKHIKQENGLPSNTVMDIEVARDGTVWVATFENGLASYKPEIQ